MPANRNRAEYTPRLRNGRAQTMTQEDVDANRSVGQAVTVGRKLRVKVVR
jgi:hypothetical protein